MFCCTERGREQMSLKLSPQTTFFWCSIWKQDWWGRGREGEISSHPGLTHRQICINRGFKGIFRTESEVWRISHQTRSERNALHRINRWRSPLWWTSCRWNSAAWTRPQRLESSILSSASEPESQVTDVEVHRSCKHFAYFIRVSISSSMLLRSNNYLYFLGICY